MKPNKELNQQVLNTAVDKKGRPTISIDKRKSIYSNINEALKAIPITNRNVGLTISVYDGTKVVEYWWQKGIKDSDLVKKINSDDIPRIDNKLIDLQNQIDGINNIEFKIFDSLPELGDSSIIYVIPNTTTQEDDDFIEYIWIKSQQRYERFGGLDADGGVTINNLYTFDNNVFTVNEESNIKNVSLNSKKIAIDDKSIEIYKYDIGEENNEKEIIISTYSKIIGNIVSNGGQIELNGIIHPRGGISTEFKCEVYPDGLNIISTYDETTNKVSLIPQSLTIKRDANKSVVTYNGIHLIENENNIFEVSKTKLYTNTGEINLNCSDKFSIVYKEDYGIFGYTVENVDTVRVSALDSGIEITNDYIELNVLGNGYVKLDSDNFNAVFNQLIYLNAPITKLKKVLFEQNSGSDIYLEPYHETNSNITYHGLKSESNIYIKDSNSYFIKNQNDYSLTSYGLNGIKHRDANVSTGLGYNVLTIGNGGTLNLGNNNQFTINSDGNCIINGYEISKIGLLGENNTNSYFIIEKGEYTLPDIRMQQNLNNYIHLFKEDYNEENYVDIKSDNFRIINNSNESVFTIEQGDYIIFKTGDEIIFYFDSKRIIMSKNGISDGTNTKTWAQLLS